MGGEINAILKDVKDKGMVVPVIVPFSPRSYKFRQTFKDNNRQSQTKASSSSNDS